MKIGLYFGTFNPIHVGHLVIANYMADYTDLDQVWFVVSPHNPLKKKSSLLPDYHRYALVEIAIADNDKLRPCDIEFKLPQPSYTTHTLAHLKEKHPEHNFCLIMGEDNLRTLHKWKNFSKIIDEHHMYVYPRVLTVQEQKELDEIGTLPDNGFHGHENVHYSNAPVMKVSSSFVRKSIADGHDVRYLLTEPVHKYVDEMNFYKK